MVARKVKTLRGLVKKEWKNFFGNSKNPQRDIRIFIIIGLWKTAQYFLFQAVLPIGGPWGGLGGLALVTFPLIATDNHMPVGASRFLNGDFFHDVDKGFLNRSSWFLIGLNVFLIGFWPVTVLAMKYVRKQR